MIAIVYKEKILRKIIFMLASTAMLAGCGTSAVVKDVVDKPVQELDLRAASQSKPIQLSKVVVKLKRGEHVGAAQGGLLCVPQANLTWKGGRMNIDSDEFTDAFKEELEKYSFKTVGDTSALFDDPSSWKSEILVAGLVKDLKANVCFPMAGFGNFSSSKGEAFIKVDWQIYSKLDRAVVHSVTTEGAFKSTETRDGGIDPIVLNAFAQAARNLLADEKFRAIVLRGGQPVKETTFKTADGVVVTAGKSQAFTGRKDEWRDGVATIFAGSGHGSGFAIGEQLLLTNQHVVGDADTVVVKLGSGFEVRGRVLAHNSRHDVALVKVEASLPRYFKLRRELPAVGTSAYALGSPLSEQLNATLTQGVVSGIRREPDRTLIQSDVSVLPGNSGGPLLTSEGEVIGITVSGIRINDASQGINFFIPIGEALEAMGVK